MRGSRRRTGIAALAVALTTALPAAGSAKTVYVATTGDDAAAGSQAAPLRTVTAGLLAAGDGGTVMVAPGEHGEVRDAEVRTGTTTVRGWDGVPTVSAIVLRGASGLRFERVKVVGPVEVNDDAGGHTRGSTRIVFDDVEVTRPGAACITVRSLSNDVTIANSHVHHCRTGIAGPANTTQSTGIVIRDNLLEQFNGDGIQFGDWDDVLIEDNVIRDMNDPDKVIHNDAIQFVGKSTGVVIRRNVALNSVNGQLVLIQNAFGPIHDVLLEDNVLVGSSGWAVQSQGVTKARFIRNLVWDSGIGGLLIRAGQPRDPPPLPVPPPTDTVLSGNVLFAFAAIEGAEAATFEKNALRCGTEGAGVPCATTLDFLDPAHGDYCIRRLSPLRVLGAGPHSLTGTCDPEPPPDPPDLPDLPVPTPTPSPGAAVPSPTTPLAMTAGVDIGVWMAEMRRLATLYEKARVAAVAERAAGAYLTAQRRRADRAIAAARRRARKALGAR